MYSKNGHQYRFHNVIFNTNTYQLLMTNPIIGTSIHYVLFIAHVQQVVLCNHGNLAQV